MSNLTNQVADRNRKSFRYVWNIVANLISLAVIAVTFWQVLR